MKIGEFVYYAHFDDQEEDVLYSQLRVISFDDESVYGESWGIYHNGNTKFIKKRKIFKAEDEVKNFVDTIRKDLKDASAKVLNNSLIHSAKDFKP